MTRVLWLPIVLVPVLWLVGQPAAPTNGRIDQVIVRPVPPPPASGVTCTHPPLVDAQRTTLVNAISAASSGDTICLPDGSAAWSSSVTVTNTNKALTIAGAAAWAGTGTTSITCSGTCFSWSSNTTSDVAIRVTGFTLTSSAPTFAINSDGGGHGPKGWRIDHIIRDNSSGSVIEFLDNSWGGPSLNSGLEGLIDNNTIYDGRIVFYGEADLPYGTGGTYRFIEDDDLGTKKAVYVEDNLFVGSSGGVVNAKNQADGRNGSRYVYRFNTFQTGRVEAHGVQGIHRAVRMSQFLFNDFTGPSSGTCVLRYFFLRGGVTVIIGNRTDGNDGCTGRPVNLDVARSHQADTDGDFASQIPGVGGPCDGDAWVDENQLGQEGWACLDQPGVGKDSTQQQLTGAQSTWAWTTTARNTYVTQARVPWILINNISTKTNADIGWDWNCVGFAASCTRQSTKLILGNRDIYTSAGNTAQTSATSPFDGTSGTGWGVIARRPTTCTAGVYYFSTDEGSWNQSTSNVRGVQVNGADGLVYKCISPNTWTLHLTPYQYPHPLRAGV